MRKISRRFGAVAGITVLVGIMLAAAMAAPAQTFRTLVNFNGTNGAVSSSSSSSLVQGTGGDLYGTTYGGGANGVGTVFKMTRGGALTTVYSFCAQLNCADGSYLLAGLVLGTDGNFYGATDGGGANGQGTIFKITPGGILTTLYSFCAQTNCADGGSPRGTLSQGSDGNFYGTTYVGGASGYGTVFKITSAGTLTTLHSFAGGDGAYPSASLVQGTDGNFYGTTYEGGAHGGVRSSK